MSAASLSPPGTKNPRSRSHSSSLSKAPPGSRSSSASMLGPAVSQAPVALDQRVRGGVVEELVPPAGRELRGDLRRERLDPVGDGPVERVEVPDRRLGEDAVLVQGNERTERRGRELPQQEDGRGVVPVQDAVQDLLLRHARRLELFGAHSPREKLRLRDQAGEEK